MLKYFKVIMILFAFFFVSACKNNESLYNTKTVSTSSSAYVVSEENEDVLKSNVMIFNNNYSKFLGLKYEENNSYGSGVIYKSDSRYYYSLTNHHVIADDKDCSSQEIYVEDYFSNRYKGVVLYSDINYDLAIVRFEKKIELNVLNISNDAATIRESVRSMGNPDSIKNVINDGMVNCFSYITLNNKNSKVDFEVIVHSALIDGGSSGGALLDSNNEIIGIIFAGVFDKKDNFIVGYAIPCEKIIEFINK